MLSARPPRVGYVLKRYPRYSETFVVNEILAHEAAGLEVEVFSLYAPNDAHFQDVIAQVRAPVTYLSASSVKAADFWSALGETGGLLPGVWAALEEARNEDAHDVYQALLLASAVQLRGIAHLHAHFGSAATSVTRLAARFAGVPYTFTAHAKDIFHESVQPDDLRRKLQDAAAVVTVSQYNLNYLRETFGHPAAHVRCIYNGLDLDRFPFSAPLNRPLVIVGVGRLVEKKGFADLVAACAILAERGREFTCRIVGSGELEAALRSQVARLGLQDRVELVGSRPQCAVINEVGGAAALAAPCVVGSDGNRDGLPTVLLEAIALGTPCVSTDVTGIPEVVRDRETGLLVPQHDPVRLAAALERLLAEPDLRVRLATAARRLVEEDFSIHRNAARLRAVFGVASRPERDPGRGEPEPEFATSAFSPERKRRGRTDDLAPTNTADLQAGGARR